MRRIFAQLVILACFAIALPFAAQPAHASEKGLFEGACILTTKSPSSFDQARRSQAWNCSPEFFDAQARHVWVRLNPANAVSGQPVIKGMSAPLDSLTVVEVDSSGAATSKRYDTGDIIANWFPGNYYTVPIQSPIETIDAIYVGLDRPDSFLLATELALMDADEADEAKLHLSILFGVCIGMMLIVAVLSAMMYLKVGYKVAGYHAIFSLLISVYVASASSLIFLVIPGMTLWDRSLVNYTSLALAISLLGPIMLRYFEREYLAPWLARLIIVSASIAFLAAGVKPMGFLFDIPVRSLYHLMYLPGCATILLTIAIMLRRGSKAVRGFIIAWAAPIVFGIERALRGSELYHLPLWLDYLFFIGLAIQAVAMTVAIALQAEAIRRQLDRARFEAEKAQDEASHDPLTGLPNRRHFLQYDWRAGQFLAMMDLDKFKQVNDRWGHDVGDAVLNAAGKALCEAAAQGRIDCAWRLGGEEFAIAVSAASMPEASRRVNAVRIALAERIRQDGPIEGLRATASAGISRVDTADIKQSYRAADSALYQAKAGGRDRVCFETRPGETATIFPQRQTMSAA